MNGYRFCIQQAIYHNSKFVWNLQRYVILNGETEAQAKRLVGPLAKGETKVVYEGETTLVDGVPVTTEAFTVTTGDEYVTQYTQNLGKATWVCKWEYEN